MSQYSNHVAPSIAPENPMNSWGPQEAEEYAEYSAFADMMRLPEDARKRVIAAIEDLADKAQAVIEEEEVCPF
jgi:hypothetical protein